MKGIGTITLYLNQGQTIHLQDVLYVPVLKKNLVSISVMEDKGFKVAFIDGNVHIWHRNPKDAFTLGFRVDGLYQVGESPLGALARNASLQFELWHQRFAHLYYKALPGRKDEVFKWFRSFKAFVEDQTGKKIKTLRTDNGTEYESKEFNDFCREAGIKRETTVPYTPEQNGVAKRKNRTIMEATCAIIYDQGLPKFLWGEAVNTAVYVQNRSLHQALDFKTLEEVFTDKKLDVSHFGIFGCSVYFHVLEEKKNKLEASRKERYIRWL
eukprot:PITA_23865